jgi:high-affinity nickel-transport protein
MAQPTLRSLFTDSADDLRGRLLGICGILLALNLGAWCWAAVVFHRFPVLLGTSLLAYSLGLRHAVDADHIAAIDNVTRRLMQDGKRPVAVGLMFSLGHSTVVGLGAAAIAGAALTLQYRMNAVRNIGGVIGTLVSVFFLFGIRYSIYSFSDHIRSFSKVRRGDHVERLWHAHGRRGFLPGSSPALSMITRSWHM